MRYTGEFGDILPSRRHMISLQSLGSIPILPVFRSTIFKGMPDGYLFNIKTKLISAAFSITNKKTLQK